VLITGATVTVGLTAVALRQLDYERIPQAAVLAAAFFVASLVSVPVGPSSVHLLLNGLMGLLLGWAAVPALLVALLLQAVFFGYGGVAVLGVNTMNVAVPALLCAALLRPLLRSSSERLFWVGAAAGALLMIEVDGPADCIDRSAATVGSAARVAGLLELHSATDAAEVAQLWKARKALSPALRKVAPKKINEDVVVPVSHIPVFMDRLQDLGQAHGITIVNFGHAGNGNIHVNLLVNPDHPQELARAETCLSAVFDLVLELRGTLSGEHGVGLEKRAFVAREIPPDTLALMHALKRQFDPNGILNPGKALPGP